jgi:nucleoside 2-deoxyribosyltransferase
MPFGGETLERRRAILYFNRLKYIIETKCRVVPNAPHPNNKRVNYEVDVARTAMDSIPDVALQKIERADVLVALLSERNFTVAYELGFRRARNGMVIIISNSKAELPIYEADVAFQSWKEDAVLQEIDRIVESEFPRLNDFEVDIPDSLQEAIDSEDGTLTESLQLALQEIENQFVPAAPDPVQKLRGVLSDAINRFYPSSVVEVRFARRGEFETPDSPATVVEFDEAFSSLYGYGSLNTAEKDRPLSLSVLLDRLSKFSDPEPWQLFMQEQTLLTDRVIKGYALARATVPIRFNDSHPDGRFAGRSFLPCMAAQVIDGNLDGPHKMYLLIAYIELDFGARSRR